MMTLLNRSVILPALIACLALAASACGEDSVQEAATAKLSISPERLLFEGVAIGNTDLQSFTVRNSGEAALFILDAQVNGPNGVFVIEDGYTPEMEIPSQGSAEFFVSYTPVQEAPSTGSIRLVTNAGDGVVDLEVRASDGRVFVNPDPVNFGRVPAGEVATIRTAITNIGGAQLVVDDFFLVSGSAAFHVPEDQLPVEPIELAPDQRYEFDVMYTPVDDGRDSGVLIVRSDDPANEEYNVDVLANDAEPCIEVSHEHDGYDFGERVIEVTHAEAFTVRNCSDLEFGENLIVDSISLLNDADYQSSDAYALAVLPQFPLDLAPGAEHAFLVEFTPTVDRQIEEAVLLVASNDRYQPVARVEMRGSGTDDVCPVPIVGCTVADSGEAPTDELVVAPLDTVLCSAYGSTDGDGEVVGYRWALLDRPEGSAAEMDRAVGVETSFFVDIAGQYVVSLEVADDDGCWSPEPATAVITTGCACVMHVQLVWTTPGDPDELDTGEGAGADIDLHMRRDDGCWGDLELDCYADNPAPDWGVVGDPTDDPRLDVDDEDGAGPENVNLDEVENGRTYSVAVHYDDDHGFGESFATVRIWLFGELVYEARDQLLPALGSWWEVASVAWPSSTVTPVDLVHDGRPSCD